MSTWTHWDFLLAGGAQASASVPPVDGWWRPFPSVRQKITVRHEFGPEAPIDPVPPPVVPTWGWWVQAPPPRISRPVIRPFGPVGPLDTPAAQFPELSWRGSWSAPVNRAPPREEWWQAQPISTQPGTAVDLAWLRPFAPPRPGKPSRSDWLLRGENAEPGVARDLSWLTPFQPPRALSPERPPFGDPAPYQEAAPGTVSLDWLADFDNRVGGARRSGEWWLAAPYVEAPPAAPSLDWLTAFSGAPGHNWRVSPQFGLGPLTIEAPPAAPSLDWLAAFPGGFRQNWRVFPQFGPGPLTVEGPIPEPPRRVRGIGKEEWDRLCREQEEREARALAEAAEDRRELRRLLREAMRGPRDVAEGAEVEEARELIAQPSENQAFALAEALHAKRLALENLLAAPDIDRRREIRQKAAEEARIRAEIEADDEDVLLLI